MSGFNGSGTFQISGVGLPFTTGTIINSTVANQLNTDLAAGLSTCILKDGTQSVTANIPFNNYNINNISAVGIGTAAPLYPLHIKNGATNLLSLTSAGNLTISGTNTSSGANTSASFEPTSSTAPTNGMYLSSANTLGFSTNSGNRLTISSTGDLTSTGNISALTYNASGSTVPANGMYLSSANTLSFSTNSAVKFTVGSTGNTTTTGKSTAAGFVPTTDDANYGIHGSTNLSLNSSSAIACNLTGLSNALQITSTGIASAGSVSGTALIPTGSATPSLGINTPTSNAISICTSSTRRLTISSSGNITPTVGSTSQIAGFMCISAAAGVPTGVPSVGAGYVPMYYDTTNNQFYVYNGAWKKVALT